MEQKSSKKVTLKKRVCLGVTFLLALIHQPLKVLWQIDYYDTWPEEQGRLQTQSGLVMQEMLPPVSHHKLW